MVPDINDIKLAFDKIKNQIHRTPVLSSQSINTISGSDVYFKCENFQKVGAFKFRGASNAVLSLSEVESKCGVATHSSGNHAQALALAAKMRNIPAYIVMPNNSPEVKKNAVLGYGAEIIYCEPTLEARESTLESVVKRTGATFIHPYNNFNVIAGQGTAALELLNEVHNLDIIMTPVGGGGLLSGTSITIKSIDKSIKVIAAEPSGADDAFRSKLNGRIEPSINPKTICDGLLTSLGTLTFKVISELTDEILVVEDEWTIKAMKLIWERMKIIVEPSACVTLGSILKYPDKFKGKKVGIILSGGNLDLTKLPF